ncbi:nucleoside monophosphate kinase [Patescibacteria group bacterium]|nr:nucleoside monophosphate kinase [Patescibacteria group bacterium]
MKILLIGPQGSGKGTIGKKLSDYLNIPLISAGQILRDLPEQHSRKEEIDSHMERGELVPQDMVADLLREETSKERCRNGFIFDGWGRAMIDLEYYDPGFDKVVYFNIPPELSVKRLSSRRTCESCGEIFNIITVPPKVDGVCDFCGGNLVQREDDTEEAVRRRLDIFNNKTMEVIDHFRAQGRLIEIDGSGTPEEVFQLVLPTLE